MANDTSSQLKPSVDVDRGIPEGCRVKITGGKVNGLSLKGFEATTLRNEQSRPNGANGRNEEMVIVSPILPDGRQGMPLDVPRRHIKGPDDLGPVSRFVGKVVAVIRGGQYIRVPA